MLSSINEAEIARTIVEIIEREGNLGRPKKQEVGRKFSIVRWWVLAMDEFTTEAFHFFK